MLAVSKKPCYFGSQVTAKLTVVNTASMKSKPKKMNPVFNFLRRNPPLVPREVKLISVHIPKTAGTAFRNLLKEVYGNKKVIRLDVPLGNKRVMVNETAWTDSRLPKEIEVVHGHFNAATLREQYEFPEDVKMITWLRNPVDRVISNYFYLEKRLKEELDEKGKGLNILSKMQCSLLEYARREINRNRQSKFLAGHQLRDFTFVGIQEHYDEDVSDLSKMLLWRKDVQPKKHNVTGSRIEVSEADRAEIASLNAEDMTLYAEGLQLRADRKQQMELELISIHIPKTAGTSFYQSLRKVYGPDLSSAFRRGNYQRMIDRYGTIKNGLNGNIRVIHGHLYYSEVAHLHKSSNAKIICWMREPVDRVISNFHFFKNNLTPPVRNLENYRLNVHRKNEDLLTYASSERTRNSMSKFLEGISLEDIFFIGFQESYEEDLRKLGKLLNWPEVYLTQLNVSNKRANKVLDITPEVRQELLELNAEDVALYQQAKAMRAQ